LALQDDICNGKLTSLPFCFNELGFLIISNRLQKSMLPWWPEIAATVEHKLICVYTGILADN
jgi:hypothetical protein